MSRPYSFIHRLTCAARGFLITIHGERHMKVHLVAFIIVLAAGFYFHLVAWEWVCLLGVSTLVITLEMVNAALERTLDLLHPGEHPAVGAAKDIMAGAVLVAAGMAVLVGLILFLPHIL
jgi:undecaprenol kinase